MEDPMALLVADLYQAAGLIHDNCPRNLGGYNQATDFGQDGRCLINLGCRGPATRAPVFFAVMTISLVD